MNTYDFDETILDGDTEIYFFKYIFEKMRIPFKYRLLYKKYKRLEIKKKKPIDITRPKMYKLLEVIPDIDKLLEDFWDIHEKDIKKWYLDQQKEDDIIISATPRFLLNPIMKRLGIKNLIATEMDKKTGVVDGVYCSKAQKVIRFRELYPTEIPDTFYSDSDSDTPMAMIAKKAYKVRGLEITEWDFGLPR